MLLFVFVMSSGAPADLISDAMPIIGIARTGWTIDRLRFGRDLVSTSGYRNENGVARDSRVETVVAGEERLAGPEARGHRAVLTAGRVVFLLDVDNTLLDNDRFAADLTARLEHDLGVAGRERYWARFTALRRELGYADYLTPLQRLRGELEDSQPLLAMSAFVLDYPFEQLLYPRALDVITHLGTLGVPVVLSDGDVVLQPRKIHRAGIWSAVGGRVIITLHKERELDAMERRFPASRYVMIDDKPALLAAMKDCLGARLTTVFVRQGHHAAQSAGRGVVPPPDHAVDRIGDLLHGDRSAKEAS